jgi:hypothetical protein
MAQAIVNSEVATPVTVFFQLSLGRFEATIDLNDTVRAAKKKFRFAVPQVAHVNLNSFHLNYNGAYFTDESKTLASYHVENGTTLHLVKKLTCPAAAVDTEKKVDE